MTEPSNSPDSPGDVPVADDTPFTVTDTHPRAGLTVIDVVGALDLRTSPFLAAHINTGTRNTAGPLVLDLTGLTFVSSNGLSVLIGAVHDAPAGELVYLIGVAGNRVVRRVFDATGIGSLFVHHPTVAALLDHLDQ